MSFFANAWTNLKLHVLDAKDPDAKVIKALKQNGSDTTKPHWIDFYFDFDQENDAKKMVEALKTVGFGAVYTDNEDGSHGCIAKKHMVPDLSTMRAMTTRFRELAIRMGGVYDGWGAEVVS